MMKEVKLEQESARVWRITNTPIRIHHRNRRVWDVFIPNEDADGVRFTIHIAGLSKEHAINSAMSWLNNLFRPFCNHKEVP